MTAAPANPMNPIGFVLPWRACRPRTSTSTSGPSLFVAAPGRRDRLPPASCGAGPSSSPASRRRRCRPAPATRPRGATAVARRRARPGAAGALLPPRDRGARPPTRPSRCSTPTTRRRSGWPEAFGPWGAVALGDARPAERRRRCSTAARSGLSLPAGALASPSGARAASGRLLGRLERARRAAVRPSRARRRARRAGAGSPRRGGPALTGYVAEMHAAWHAFAAWGRAAHPRLRVVFAMLAGLAPLHAERLAARGGPAERVHDPLIFYDTSSYGPRAIDAMLGVVGIDQLVHGTDRPSWAPPGSAALGAAAAARLPTRNAGPPARRGRRRDPRRPADATSSRPSSRAGSRARRRPGALGGPRPATTPASASTRSCARRGPRGVADLLDGRPRHRLPRPRRLGRRRRGRRRRGARGAPVARRPPAEPRTGPARVHFDAARDPPRPPRTAGSPR